MERAGKAVRVSYSGKVWRRDSERLRRKLAKLEAAGKFQREVTQKQFESARIERQEAKLEHKKD